MQLRQISNTIAALVSASAYFQSYHFGYHSDINAAVDNAYNQHAAVGNLFPRVLWVVPVEGTLKMDTRAQTTQVELYFYNLQGYDNAGEPLADTLLTQWDELHSRAVEFLHALFDSDRYSKRDIQVDWFTDANAHNDRLICVGARFAIGTRYACADYEGTTPLLPLLTPAAGDTDAEVTY